MALKPLLNFSSGELDPILHDNVTLEKFNKGLSNARNVMITKLGSISSRFATAHVIKSKNDGEAIKILALPNYSAGNVKFAEWGPAYVRIISVSLDFFRGAIATVDATVAHSFTASDLNHMHFVTSGDFVYVFVSGKATAKFNYVTYAFVSNFLVLTTTASKITTATITPAGTPSDYQVDYAISLVFNGEEYVHNDLTSAGTYNRPAGTGESNTIDVDFGVVATADIPKFTELRIYRRPHGGGAFGFIGSTNNFSLSGTSLICSYIDLGGNADFTNGVIDVVTKSGLNGALPKDLTYKTGTIYQQRLLVAPDSYKETILASRPQFKDNFYRDFPYDADSALNFKTGSEGNARILRMIDNDGLIVFTSIGAYVGLGLLNIDNVVLIKKGSWVIDEAIPPLSVPGGVFFIDKSTNDIKQFIYSDQIGTYQALEHSIFSNHLFEKKRVSSWCFQSGVNPLMLVTLTDGTFLTFTYSLEHQMRAWTRHDSTYPIEQVEGTGLPDTSFFVVNKDGNRYITVSLPRKPLISDSFYPNYFRDVDKTIPQFLLDAARSYGRPENDLLGPGDEFELTPVTPDDWEGELTLTCGTSGLFTAGGTPAGTIFRIFLNDKSSIDLKVLSRTSDDEVTVKPSYEYPSDQATGGFYSGFNLYRAGVSLGGLTHLEGEDVAVIIDGCLVASPNNDEENFATYTVSGGAITLAEEHRGAIIIVGRPVTADVKTLNISTAEQKPTTLESLTVNKLYLRVSETKGLYVSDVFPEEKIGEKDGATVKGMEDLDLFYVPDGYDIEVNKYKAPVSTRIEKTIPGNWKSNGQISIRQVDPFHFEILSIIPDIEVLWRSDR